MDYSYDRQALKETLVIVVIVGLFMAGVSAVISRKLPTFAESVAHCRTACEANNMVMKGYSTGKYGGCSCEVGP